MRKLLLLLVLAAIAGGAVFSWPRLEGEAPTITAPARVALGTGGARVEVEWADAQTGLRSVEAFLEVDTDARPLLTRSLHARAWPGALLAGAADRQTNERVEIALDPKTLAVPDGPATLVLRASDWAWSDFFAGNQAELRVPVVVDTAPPRIASDTGLTYATRGGSAVAVYRVSADTVRHGVRVGDAFFAGTTLADDREACIYALPIDVEPGTVPVVVATDEAGNEATVRLAVRVKDVSFPTVPISLSQRFLDNVAAEFGDGGDAVATFRRVNEELRVTSEQTIRGAVGAPTPRRFRGAFEQMANSKVTSDFAELRHYTVDGQRVSQARHYGFDLASTAHAPITASNDGVVVFAGPNGIYGNLVMLDHGLGVTSLYGHLSSIDVAVGDDVLKGRELGRSGATGLAGGDHLHFAILVGATYVDPREWWDAKWVREHVDALIAPDALASTGP
ncbi:MAG: M23 family metallopeptidase [Myxococcales bacterium]|nr:M23 family metallopeptidase [Myxococcales bacterium]